MTNLGSVLIKALTDPRGFLRKVLRRTNIDYHLLKRSFFPKSVVIIPTYRCNLRCKMCFLFDEQGESLISAPSREELPLSKWQKIIEEIAAFAPHIYLVGGEPLLYKNSLALINSIKAAGLLCSMDTNGILLEERADEIVQSGLDYMNVSIDGPEAIHNDIRGSSQAFQRVMAGLVRINQAKARRKRSTPSLFVNCVVSAFNYQYLTEVMSAVRDLGLTGLRFQHPMFTNQGVLQHHNDLFATLFQSKSASSVGFDKGCTDNIEIERLIQELAEVRRVDQHLAISFLPSLRNSDEIRGYYGDLFYPFRRGRCLAPWTEARILPNGDVPACLGYPDYIVGNVLQEAFTALWNNEKYRSFRRNLKGAQLFPACYRCCRRQY
jgi:radical SAM protein with 4Fe4S-binding SPASM domain